MSRPTEYALPKRLPNVGNNRPTLTRTEQVLKAIRKGARIEATGERGLLRLLDRKGIEIPAWQTAMQAAQRQTEQEHSNGCKHID